MKRYQWIFSVCAFLLLCAPKAWANYSAAIEEMVLDFLNGHEWSVIQLDIDAGLYARAAANIYNFRAGPDRTLGTWDDRVLKSLSELNGIPDVGCKNIQRLVHYLASLQD